MTQTSSHTLLKNMLLLGVVLNLSACASLGDRFKTKDTAVDAAAAVPQPPTQEREPGYLETAWAESGPSERPSTRWVMDFGDPVLAELVREAMDENPSLNRAAALIDASEAAERIAKANKLPTVSADAAYGRTESGRKDRAVVGNSFSSDQSSFRLGASVDWEADLWGRIQDQVDIGTLDYVASNFDYAGARLSVSGSVANAWFDLIEAKLLTDLSIRDVETQERALRLTERRFNLSGSGASDIRLARSQLASSQALQASRELARSNAARRLEVLLRRYPAAAVEAATDLPTLPPLTGVGRPEDILVRRPDLRAAEARLDASGLRVDAARKAMLPRLTLNARPSASSTNLADFIDVESLLLNLGANLLQPIFQGGRLKADVARNEAQLRAGLEDYASSALTAYREVEDGLSAESRLAEREAALRVSLDESAKAEERLQRRYTEGLATIFELLNAQSRRLSAESQLINARKERLANRVRLHLALGGGDLAIDGSQTVVSAPTDSSSSALTP